MKAIVLGAIGAILATTLVSPADASTYKKKKYARHHGYVMSQPYPYASERQRQNTYAYENGGYYERLQSAHVFGSRAWWELQERGAGRR